MRKHNELIKATDSRLMHAIDVYNADMFCFEPEAGEVRDYDGFERAVNEIMLDAYQAGLPYATCLDMAGKWGVTLTFADEAEAFDEYKYYGVER